MAGDALERTQAFFGPRAVSWDERFPDDDAAFARAAHDLGVASGERVLDVGCGTGRAMAALREAVGEDGVVVGVDATPQMLATARRKERHQAGSLVLADARSVPLTDASVDAVFAAGLITHVEDPVATLRELARVTRPTGRLALFHPIGRAALAERHGRALRPDELLDPSVLPGVLASAGWGAPRIDDARERLLGSRRESLSTLHAVSVPVALDRLRDEIAGFHSAPFLLTVSDDGRPHCVSVAIEWRGDELAMGAGNRTTTNAAARPSVSLLWPANGPGEFSLIVDGTVTSSGGTVDGDNVVTVRPTSAVLHRPAAGGGSDCAPVLRT